MADEPRNRLLGTTYGDFGQGPYQVEQWEAPTVLGMDPMSFIGAGRLGVGSIRPLPRGVRAPAAEPAPTWADEVTPTPWSRNWNHGEWRAQNPNVQEFGPQRLQMLDRLDRLQDRIARLAALNAEQAAAQAARSQFLAPINRLAEHAGPAIAGTTLGYHLGNALTALYPPDEEHMNWSEVRPYIAMRDAGGTPLARHYMDVTRGRSPADLTVLEGAPY